MIVYYDVGMTSKGDHERIVAGSPSIILLSGIFNNHGRLLRPNNQFTYHITPLILTYMYAYDYQKVIIKGSENG